MPRILLVEDDAASAPAIRNLLGSDGHDVLPTDNGETALSLIENGDIDVVIIDVAMREASRLVEAFHQRVSGVPVVAIAGHGFRGCRRVQRNTADKRCMRGPGSGFICRHAPAMIPQGL